MVHRPEEAATGPQAGMVFARTPDMNAALGTDVAAQRAIQKKEVIQVLHLDQTKE
jgi:hypothetical protein